MVITAIEEWWDRYGNQDKKDKINEIIAAINANISTISGHTAAIAGHTTDIAARMVKDPDYDSGWFAIAVNGTVTKTHNLGTLDVLVQIMGKTSGGDITIRFFGGWAGTASVQGGWWQTLTTTQISARRHSNDLQWPNFRFMLWKAT